MADHHQQHQSPIASVFCPPPINIVICSNTFVKFLEGGVEVVGLVLHIDAVREVMSMRLFLTWEAVKERIGLNGCVDNVSFWPKDGCHPPYYVCDTDLVVNDVPTSKIFGLAFVFYDTSPNVRLVNGMRNTYRVTSCTWFSRNLITHGITFSSFPTECFPQIVMSSFPSVIFTQLLSIKRKLQQILNTQSLSSKNSSSAQVDNIDNYTWLYMVRDSPVEIQNSLVVSRASDVVLDEFIQRSWREQQLSFWVGDENHLAYAQSLFGLNFGVGIRFTVSCRLNRNESYAKASRTIAASDTLNILPFESTSRELVRRGVFFKYKPASRVLSIIVRYHRLIGEINFLNHLEARGMAPYTPDNDGSNMMDNYPFHYNVLVDGCNIEQYNFGCNHVRLSDSRVLSKEAVIGLINRDLQQRVL
jgi:hypothetical protein